MYRVRLIYVLSMFRVLLFDTIVIKQYDTRMIPDPNNYQMKRNKEQRQTAVVSVKAFIPDMDDEQLRKLAREKLSEALQAIDPVAQPAMTRALCAEVKDRLDGKPSQAISMDATLRQITVTANIRFTDELPLQVVGNNQVIDNES